KKIAKDTVLCLRRRAASRALRGGDPLDRVDEIRIQLTHALGAGNDAPFGIEQDHYAGVIVVTIVTQLVLDTEDGSQPAHVGILCACKGPAHEVDLVLCGYVLERFGRIA